MPQLDDHYYEPVVFDFGDETVVSDAIFPELAEAFALQCLPDRAWILEWRDSLLQEFCNAKCDLFVERV